MTEASEPVVQVNTWMANPSSAYNLNPPHTPSRGDDSLVLEDLQTDEEKLHDSPLSSESAFLPVSSSARSPSHPDSEEEELDEPDSLAQPNPARAHPRKVETATSFGSLLNQIESPASVTDHTAEERPNLQEDKMLPLHVDKAANATEAGTELRELSANGAECHPDQAAVKIQAWWRGHRTRHHHPQAKDVRCEIRLRRLQDHVVYLTAKLNR